MTFDPNKLPSDNKQPAETLTKQQLGANEKGINPEAKKHLHSVSESETKPVTKEDLAQAKKIAEQKTNIEEAIINAEMYRNQAEQIYSQAAIQPEFAYGDRWSADSTEFRQHEFTKELANLYKTLADLYKELLDNPNMDTEPIEQTKKQIEETLSILELERSLKPEEMQEMAEEIASRPNVFARIKNFFTRKK